MLEKCPICQESVAMYFITVAKREIKVCYQCFQLWKIQLEEHVKEEISYLVKGFRCSVCKERASKIKRFNEKLLTVCDECYDIMSRLHLYQYKTFKELKEKVKKEREKERKKFLERIKGSIENLEILWGKFSEDSFYGQLKQIVEEELEKFDKTK
jgi:hypothetical protein